MRKAFGVLARLKGLRGGALDVFGRTDERRTERALIGEYRACIDELLRDAERRATCALAAEIARIPEDIRGYGHVKERHLAAARPKWEALMRAGAPGRCSRRLKPRRRLGAGGMNWPALAARGARDAAARLPFVIDGVRGRLGRADAPAGAAGAVAAARAALAVDDRRRDAAGRRPRRARWPPSTPRCASQGLIMAWRDELFDLPDPPPRARRAGPHRTRGGALLGHPDAAARTPPATSPTQRRPAHAPVDRPALVAQGHRPRPARQHWSAAASPPATQPAQTLRREAWEEAGLTPTLCAAAVPAG